MSKDRELESFKTINLTEYAANQGYMLRPFNVEVQQLVVLCFLRRRPPLAF